jgi:hypothetical protein
MAAIGGFAVTDYAAMRQRMIIRAPAPKAPTAPTTTPPPSRIPLTVPKFVPPVILVDPIVPTTAPTAPAPTGGGGAPTGGGGGGGTGGTVTDSGSTGGGGASSDDNARLLNALGSLFKSQDVAQSMAPVSFAPTGGETGATTADGGGSKVGAIIFLAVLVAGGAYWYTHR